MTRETKIGLLVGLAFIIVIGILLSDHLTSATEPPPAQLTQVGNNVRSSTASPGSNRVTQPVVNNTVQQPTGPQHAVPTQNELANRGAPPVQIINVGGPAAPDNNTGTTLQATSPSNPPITMQQPQNNNQGNAPVVVNNPGGNIQQDPAHPNPPSNDPIGEIARRHGEELVGPNDQPINGGNNPPQNPPVISTSSTSYVAQPGDSVSKLAAKFLGSNNKANREAIINANPSLKADANKIIVGKSYTIPGKVSSPNKPEASAPARTDAPSSPDRTAQKPPTTATQDHWYTVQPGDSLWKIASTQCGDAKAIAAIKELNKDIIKNDTVQAGQKIRLPNAPK